MFPNSPPKQSFVFCSVGGPYSHTGRNQNRSDAVGRRLPTPTCNFASQLATHLTSLHRPPTCYGMASEEAIVENHNTLFLVDGNVLLSAPSSESSVTAFRVHQSLLMRHSGVFQNLLSDLNGLEKRDGMPSLRLSIPAERVECLLQYIYGDLCVSLIVSLAHTLLTPLSN